MNYVFNLIFNILTFNFWDPNQIILEFENSLVDLSQKYDELRLNALANENFSEEILNNFNSEYENVLHTCTIFNSEDWKFLTKTQETLINEHLLTLFKESNEIVGNCINEYTKITFNATTEIINIFETLLVTEHSNNLYNLNKLMQANPCFSSNSAFSQFVSDFNFEKPNFYLKNKHFDSNFVIGDHVQKNILYEQLKKENKLAFDEQLQILENSLKKYIKKYC